MTVGAVRKPFKTIHRVFDAAPKSPWSVCWVISAPWAHRAWWQYVIALYDLTTPTDTPPRIYREGVTHEVTVWALNPDYPIAQDNPLIVLPPGAVLDPPNHAYQFVAASNDEALARARKIVDDIENKRLSPDTDARRAWDAIFINDDHPGGVTLREARYVGW